MGARHTAIVLAALGIVGCAGIIGIEDLRVEPSGTPPSPGPGIVDAGQVETGDGRPLKRVFVTSDLSSGAMGGLTGADGICASAGKSGTNVGAGPWVAWLSAEGKNAIDRITYDGPYYLPDGRKVVSNKSQLVSGKLDSPINITEKGEPATEVLYVWTGTLPNGQLGVDCNNWSTSVVAYGTAGSLDQTADGLWTDNGGVAGFRNLVCHSVARLYCFEL